MNPRNVDALALALFQAQAQQPNAQVTMDDLRGTPWMTLAERLADCGVLATAALSDDDIDAVAYGAYGDHLFGVPDYQAGRFLLAQIARGAT